MRAVSSSTPPDLCWSGAQMFDDDRNFWKRPDEALRIVGREPLPQRRYMTRQAEGGRSNARAPDRRCPCQDAQSRTPRAPRASDVPVGSDFLFRRLAIDGKQRQEPVGETLHATN